MVVKELEVLNELGFHARVACRITRAIGAFQSAVHVRKDENLFDLKNVTGVVMANAKCGDKVLVEIEGPDEQEAAEAIEKLFQEKFGER